MWNVKDKTKGIKKKEKKRPAVSVSVFLVFFLIANQTTNRKSQTRVSHFV
jgi:hypothetical protein